MGQERLFIVKAIDRYFENDNAGVRRYQKKEKNFNWLEDVWPYYRQTMEHNYSGPTISEEEHKEFVKIHLYKEWIKEYPEDPHLPLLVSVDLYM